MFYLGSEWNSPMTLGTFQGLHFVVLLQQTVDVNNTATGKLEEVTRGVVEGGSLTLETETELSTWSTTRMTTRDPLLTFLLAPGPGAV